MVSHSSIYNQPDVYPHQHHVSMIDLYSHWSCQWMPLNITHYRVNTQNGKLCFKSLFSDIPFIRLQNTCMDSLFCSVPYNIDICKFAPMCVCSYCTLLTRADTTVPVHFFVLQEHLRLLLPLQTLHVQPHTVLLFSSVSSNSGKHESSALTMLFS